MQFALLFLWIYIFVNFTNSKFSGKYIIKRTPKTMQSNEWGFPQAPAMAYDIYPGVEWHTLNQNYNEMIPGEDIAQIETMVGKALPTNSKLIAQVNSQIITNANKLKNR